MGPSSSSAAYTGVIMRALLASLSTDRISHSAILVAGTLCGVLVFFVAVPLALSSPFPAPRKVSGSSTAPHIAAPLTRSPTSTSGMAARESELVVSWSFVSLPESGAASKFEPASSAIQSEVDRQLSGCNQRDLRPPSPPPRPKPAAEASRAIMDDVDDYLWEVYQRAPVQAGWLWRLHLEGSRRGQTLWACPCRHT